MKLFRMQYSAVSCYFLSLRPNHLPLALIYTYQYKTLLVRDAIPQSSSLPPPQTKILCHNLCSSLNNTAQCFTPKQTTRYKVTVASTPIRLSTPDVKKDPVSVKLSKKVGHGQWQNLWSRVWSPNCCITRMMVGWECRPSGSILEVRLHTTEVAVKSTSTHYMLTH